MTLVVAVLLAIFGLGLSVSLLLLLVRSQRRQKLAENETKKALEAKAQAQRDRDNAVQQARRELKLQYETQYKQDVATLRQRFNSENTHMIAQALVGESFQNLQNMVLNSTDKRYTRLAQELTGSLVDEAEGMTRDLNFELCERIWDSFQVFKEVAKESPFIFPDGTKFAYTKGIRSVVVIEQKPQVRSVTFASEMVGMRSRERAQQETSSGYRFSLAFPYVYFIIVFDRAKYKYHELYFRNKPLTSVREHIYLAPIPNVWRDKGENYRPMCMGQGFHEEVKEELTITRQCDLVISDFWQRPFNAHLGTGGHEKIDNRLKNYATWQANTEKNPLFILEVPWTKGKTIKGVIEMALDQREMKERVDQVDAHIRTLLTGGVERISQKLKTKIEEVRSNVQIVDFGNEARALVEAVTVEHANKVFEQCVRKQGE